MAALGRGESGIGKLSGPRPGADVHGARPALGRRLCSWAKRPAVMSLDRPEESSALPMSPSFSSPPSGALCPHPGRGPPQPEAADVPPGPARPDGPPEALGRLTWAGAGQDEGPSIKMEGPSRLSNSRCPQCIRGGPGRGSWIAPNLADVSRTGSVGESRVRRTQGGDGTRVRRLDGGMGRRKKDKKNRPAFALPKEIVLSATPESWRTSVLTTEGGMLCGRLGVPINTDPQDARAAATAWVTDLARDVHDTAVEVNWDPPEEPWSWTAQVTLAAEHEHPSPYPATEGQTSGSAEARP